jgi:hypothetical protein
MPSQIKRIEDVRSLARAYAPLCIKTLGNIVANGENENARIAAAGMLLDRGWGKVATAFDPDGGDVVVTIRQISARLGDAPQVKTIEHDDTERLD